MKNIIFVVTLLLLINVNCNVAAANIVVKKYKVDVKCHIELVGGKPLIYFASVKESRVNKLVDTLANRKVPTPFSKDRQQVYRAFECVLLKAKFNSVKANQLFDEQPR
ncbi:TapY2 family type IVa secretion system protein [Colwellia sp. C1TZA3]|uniref:TapY2 family type IVa secretion system protein n=1 Tax=Colwellia sp. C1TZA3 TaxID=2508879 RepID=UPI0011B9F963|nr:TapY2 family type IVa secretion system protein [Colwellia sp. C1TZA3]TWX66553.1 hypothetical protein ESZ39_14040 [Colwellia sp. C1TZA3]